MTVSARRLSRGVAALAASATAVLAVQVLPAPAWAADYTVVDQQSCLDFLTGTGSSGSASAASCRVTTGQVPATDTATFAGPAVLSNDGGLTVAGALTVDEAPAGDPDQVRFSSFGTLTNTGTVTVAGAMEDYGQLVNEAAGTLSVTGTYLGAGADAVNRGSITVEGGTWTLRTPFQNDGTLAVDCASTFVLEDDGDVLGTAPEFACGPTGVALTPATVAPGQPARTPVGTLSTAQATPRGPYAYEVLRGPFVASGDQLLTRRSLAAGSYAVTVRTTDAQGAYVDQALTVAVAVPPVTPVPPTGGPVLTAVASSPTGINEAGWSRSPVTVTYACTPTPGATLVTPCPAADVVADRKVPGLTLARTITDSLGRSASVSVLVRVDQKKPRLKVRGVRRGATYDEVRKVRCKAKDGVSGIKSCKVRQTRTTRPDGVVVVRFKVVAKDVAGNKKKRSGRYLVD